MRITTDRTEMNVAAIHAFLSEESYWAKGIPLELVERALEHSLCFAALDGEATVGFARVITDYATFGYLADVFVLPSHRGRGISKRILQAITEHPALQGLRRWQLVTRDAHGLYAQFGFSAPAVPERHMERTVRDAYRTG